MDFAFRLTECAAMELPRRSSLERTSTKHAFYGGTALCAIGLVVPSLILFCVQVFVGHIGPLAAIRDILERQFAKGHNLFLIAAFGLIPFSVLSVACIVAAKRISPARLVCFALGGLIGILALMVPGHVSIWYPLYGPGRASSTAVLGFIFLPFYCIGTLGIGLLVGWLISMLSPFRKAREIA